jgi:hypothetical protein
MPLALLLPVLHGDASGRGHGSQTHHVSERRLEREKRAGPREGCAQRRGGGFSVMEGREKGAKRPLELFDDGDCGDVNTALTSCLFD